MTGLVECCLQYYGSKNLYEVLGVAISAKAEDVKRAYFKLSLRVHPDKVEGDARDLATKKFQVLGKVYAILSDDDKRALYDESGDVDEEVENEERDWDKYWRLLFKKITPQDIEDFKLKYLDSEEEIEDVRKAYLKYEGDMDLLVQCVPFADVEAEPRLRDIIQELIDSDQVPEYDAFVHEDEAKRNKRKKKAQREAAAAKKTNQKGDCEGDSMASLAAAMARNAGRREQQMGSLLASLEAKYGGADKAKGSRGKTKKAASPLPTKAARSKK